MKRSRRILILTISVLLVLAVFTMAYAAGKTKDKAEKGKEVIWEVVPGRNFAGIYFGKTHIGSALKYFGNLDGRSKDKTTVYYQKSWGLSFTYNKKTNKVNSVMIMRPGARGRKYILNSKISVGDPIKKAHYAYGKPGFSVTKKGYKIDNYFIKDEFLTFFSKGGKIMMIWTGKKEAYDEKLDQVKEQLQ